MIGHKSMTLEMDGRFWYLKEWKYMRSASIRSSGGGNALGTRVAVWDWGARHNGEGAASSLKMKIRF